MEIINALSVFIGEEDSFNLVEIEITESAVFNNVNHLISLFKPLNILI